LASGEECSEGAFVREKQKLVSATEGLVKRRGASGRNSFPQQLDEPLKGEKSTGRKVTAKGARGISTCKRAQREQKDREGEVVDERVLPTILKRGRSRERRILRQVT